MGHLKTKTIIQLFSPYKGSRFHSKPKDTKKSNLLQDQTSNQIGFSYQIYEKALVAFIVSFYNIFRVILVTRVLKTKYILCSRVSEYLEYFCMIITNFCTYFD